jgi:hypothetical protein
MQTGEYKNMGTYGKPGSDGYGIYSGDNGEIFLEGFGVSIFSMGGGTIHFDGCSCQVIFD